MKTAHEAIAEIRAEIERRIELAEHRIDNNREVENPESVDIEQLIKWNAKRDLQICHQDGKAEALKDLLSFFESEHLLDDDEEIIEEIIPVEEKDVDLKREIDDYIEGCLGSLNGREIASCARYFFNLGLNSKK